MSEQPTNKTTGGVWVACSERLPEERHLDEFQQVEVRYSGNLCGRVYYKHIGPQHLYWLDTTIPMMTVAEHEAAIAKLHKEFGCELRDPNGTIWEQAARLQRENEEFRARIEELEQRKGGTNGD